MRSVAIDTVIALSLGALVAVALVATMLVLRSRARKSRRHARGGGPRNFIDLRRHD